MINRKPIFVAVRQLRGGQPFTIDEVHLLDAAIDAALKPEAPAHAKVYALRKPDAFYGHMRGTRILGPTLTPDEVSGCEAILAACGTDGWGVSWTAYALATAYHEVAGTMKPIKEYGRGKGRKYGRPGKHGGQIAFGRGYVQLTWDYNYERADKELGLNGALIKNYELALDPVIAAKVMVGGMADGWFTGKKLGDTLPIDGQASREAFRKSRPIINGRDKDSLIAGYAVEFQAALVKGEWA